MTTNYTLQYDPPALQRDTDDHEERNWQVHFLADDDRKAKECARRIAGRGPVRGPFVLWRTSLPSGDGAPIARYTIHRVAHEELIDDRPH